MLSQAITLAIAPRTPPVQQQTITQGTPVIPYHNSNTPYALRHFGNGSVPNAPSVYYDCETV